MNNRVLFGITLLICGVIAPALTIINYDSFLFGGVSVDYPKVFILEFGTVLAYFAGFAFPLGLFSYIHKRKKSDFYSSMPVKRSQYFWGYFLSGIIAFTVCFGYFFFIHFALFHFDLAAFESFWQPFVMFFSVYCSMILAVCFSGSIMSALVTFTLRNGLFLSLILLPVMIANVNAECYWAFFEKKICAVTPLAAVTNTLYERYDIMLIQALISVGELIIAFLLHRFRKSESTMAIAFPKSRYLFQYIVMLMIALTADAALSLMLYSDFYYTDGKIVFNSIPFYKFVFFTLIIIFISFIILNIILEKNSRAAFSKMRHFFIFCGCYGAILFLLFNYIAPIIPQQILPFTADYVVICEDSIKVEEEVNEKYPEEIGGAYYNFTISSTGKAHALFDRSKIKALSEQVQKGTKGGGDFFSGLSYDIYINNKEQINTVKCYRVYFVKGKVPNNPPEKMSVAELDNFKEYDEDYCCIRYCVTFDETFMEQFMETELTDTKTLVNKGFTRTHWISDGE